MQRAQVVLTKEVLHVSSPQGISSIVALPYRSTPSFSTSLRIAKWQARDPLPNAERLEGLNLYEYVRGRTLGRIDPTGLIDWKVVIVCILGACSPDGPEDPPKPPSPPPSSQPACPKAGPTPKPSPTPLNPKTIPWWFAVPITVVGILSTS